MRTPVVSILALALSCAAGAADGVYAPGSVAIRGYDPVAYFLDGKPEKGIDAFSITWRGAIWKFATREHLEKFTAAPEKYAPQFGGYCTYGASLGHLATSEPAAWSIVAGKLYLHHSEPVRDRFLRDPLPVLQRADSEFPILIANPDTTVQP